MTASTETRPEAPVVALSIEVSATVQVTQTVDLVKTFTGLSETAKQRYLSMDYTEVGFEAEWERPMAFLWPDEHDLVPISMCPGDGFANGDVNDASMRLSSRNGTRLWGKDAQWTEADFNLLVSHVPWMQSHYERLAALTAMTAEDRDRVPGPDDVPLF